MVVLQGRHRQAAELESGPAGRRLAAGSAASCSLPCSNQTCPPSCESASEIDGRHRAVGSQRNGDAAIGGRGAVGHRRGTIQCNCRAAMAAACRPPLYHRRLPPTDGCKAKQAACLPLCRTCRGLRVQLHVAAHIRVVPSLGPHRKLVLSTGQAAILCGGAARLPATERAACRCAALAVAQAALEACMHMASGAHQRHSDRRHFRKGRPTCTNTAPAAAPARTTNSNRRGCWLVAPSGPAVMATTGGPAAAGLPPAAAGWASLPLHINGQGRIGEARCSAQVQCNTFAWPCASMHPTSDTPQGARHSPEAALHHKRVARRSRLPVDLGRAHDNLHLSRRHVVPRHLLHRILPAWVPGLGCRGVRALETLRVWRHRPRIPAAAHPSTCPLKPRPTCRARWRLCSCRRCPAGWHGQAPPRAPTGRDRSPALWRLQGEPGGHSHAWRCACSIARQSATTLPQGRRHT